MITKESLFTVSFKETHQIRERDGIFSFADALGGKWEVRPGKYVQVSYSLNGHSILMHVHPSQVQTSIQNEIDRHTKAQQYYGLHDLPDVWTIGYTVVHEENIGWDDGKAKGSVNHFYNIETGLFVCSTVPPKREVRWVDPETRAVLPPEVPTLLYRPIPSCKRCLDKARKFQKGEKK